MTVKQRHDTIQKTHEKERMSPVKKYGGIILIWALFEAVAVVLWITLHNIFYLFNFSYIGTCLSLGLFFYT